MPCAFTMSEHLLLDAYWIEALLSTAGGDGVYMGKDESVEFRKGDMAEGTVRHSSQTALESWGATSYL